MSMSRRIVIVSPALAAANTGNWHTADRWSRMLVRSDYRVDVAARWRGPAEDGEADALVALHARRSAASIDAFARAHPQRGLVVVLTGTDLYRDIASDADAQRSLVQATHLVVLQEQGVHALPERWRAKARVIFQSAEPLAPATKNSEALDVVMAGHLRTEKDPLAFMRAAALLARREDLRFEHIGDALDPALGVAARELEREHPRYRWRGGLPRSTTRERIRRAHLLVNASRMEGGAQVVIEAVQGATAVLASRIGGHVGLLGAEHPGLFEPGDAQALARLIERARDEPGFLHALVEHGATRAHRFAPDAERSALLHLLRDALS